MTVVLDASALLAYLQIEYSRFDLRSHLDNHRFGFGYTGDSLISYECDRYFCDK
ncbi:MAG: hypothetical protein KME09_02455 [Pleurocapsa minor HA4230-MV1]|jgi:hypothetical protein|nr:hypothetical protein [Pleurocapsa minor HA4230-MV1]